LPGFLDVVGTYIGHYGYWSILLLVMIEDFGIPVPGETILIAGGIYAGAGQLNVVTVGIIGFVAAVIGDNIGFAIGHFGGRALALRWGKYIFLTEERLDKTEAFFNRHGGKIIVVARFIEGLRQANGIIAGITGMRWRHFLAYNVVGAALWVGAWVSIGYFAGSSIDSIYHAITKYSYYVLIVLVVLVVAYIIWRVRRRRRAAAARAGRTGPAQDATSAARPRAAQIASPADHAAAADASPAGGAPAAHDTIPSNDAIPASDAFPASDAIPANGTHPADDALPADDAFPADDALPADENGTAGHSRPAGSVQAAGDDAHSGS
jgi:membrane protein DedA with SNARE-associated domain